ncbi:sigma 54-interacting transcriptional regulator [Clostridium sp. BSD9I1]|uniref:sigma 54-interacting transcriptional regulator n=1 Tax=Clostridium sp. BSD9I1 TaxID=2003589 RepID=UPI00164836D3|nr:sigma 54-interacting transcriptional regulator [Clostridium sp. BSD9I1]
MKDIVFIAPFERLRILAQEVVESKRYSNIEVVYGDLSGGVEVAKKVIEAGARVIISRGGTYTMIKNLFNLPVVELQATSFDILRGFKELMMYRGRIGVAGYENIIYGCETIGELLNLDIAKIKINNEEEAEEILKQYIQNEAIEVFVGDTIGSKAAMRLGCKSYMIESGIESILYAMQEARRILTELKIEKERTEKLRTIMNFIHDGIIAIDDKGIVNIFNSMAEKIFGVSEQEAIGKHIEDVVENTKLSDVLKSSQMEIGDIQDVGKAKIATNRVPIIVDDDVTGVVATFQDITKIQDLEHHIRVKLQKKGFIAKYMFEDIIYKSSQMRECINKAKTYSQYDSPVLILGASGVGKELFAQSIHNSSSRKNAPFVAVNCAAFPPTLIESELFGYVEGAFTGSAKGGKAGVFELAHGGTIFLDEIGELSLEVQSRFLRVIQEREVMRIGDDKVIPIDVRIITATHRNIREMIRERKFREDLYYRINILTVIIPALNSRQEDIIELSKFFINEYSNKYNKKVKKISRKAEEYLNTYIYKGNVRELEGIIERAVILCNKDEITLESIKLEYMEAEGSVNKKNNKKEADKYKTLKELENEYINEVISHCEGNLSEASKILDVNRTTLWRRRNSGA